MGTTCDSFQALGNCPDDMDKLKSLVIEGAIEWAVLLSIRADIPSGPLALDVSSDCNSSKTSDLEHSNSCGQTLCDETIDADGTRGGTDVLKHCSKPFNLCCQTIRLALPNHSIRVAKLFDRYPRCKTIRSGIVKSFDPRLKTIQSAL